MVNQLGMPKNKINIDSTQSHEYAFLSYKKDTVYKMR